MRPLDPLAAKFIDAMGDEDLPETERTAFEIRELTATQKTFLQDIPGVGATTIAALALGLTGSARNYVDLKGVEVKLVRDASARPLIDNIRPWKVECLSYLPQLQMDHLANKILRSSAQEEAEVKNS